MTKKLGSVAARLGIYAVGIILVSLGIVLCKKCGLGISPISCIPFVLEKAVPLSFGTLTMFFHLANTLAQALLKRRVDFKLALQVPVAFVFGQVIDFIQGLIVISPDLLYMRIGALVLSVLFTALGMVCMVDMNLVQNPPDGTVKVISARWHKEFGRVKIGYDLICVIGAAAFSLIFLGNITGIGVATIVSAVFVGRTVSVIRWGRQRIAPAALIRQR